MPEIVAKSKTLATIHGGGHSFWQWGSTSYSISGGSGGIGALPGHTWVTVYSSVNSMDSKIEIGDDGSFLLSDLISKGVNFKINVPAADLFFMFGDDVPIGSINTGIGFVLGGIETSASKALDRTISYYSSASKIKPPQTMIKIPGGSVHVSTQVLGNVSRGLKIGGWASGGLGMGITIMEISTGEKSFFGEGGLDLIMGGIAFVPGWGWVASSVYFGGKMILEGTGNDFW